MADIQNGRHLKAVRVFAELTQKELAEKAGISVSTLALLEGRDLLPLIWSDKISFSIHKIFDDMGIDILDNCGMKTRDGTYYVGLAPKTNEDNKQSIIIALKIWDDFIDKMKAKPDIYFNELEIDIEQEDGTFKRALFRLENIQTTGTSLADEGVVCDFNAVFKFKKK